MPAVTVNQRIEVQEDYISIAIAGFLQARRVENLSSGSLKFYRNNLQGFETWCDTQAIKTISQITPDVLRQYFLHLEDVGHSAGGIHAAYRSLRAFLNWNWAENELASRNPIARIKSPKIPDEPIQGVTNEQFELLLDACGKNLMGIRDRTILYVLMDTGLRAQELCDLQVEDVSLNSNEILIRRGKGRKSRVIFFGGTTRKVLRGYLRHRRSTSPWLFITRSGDKLGYEGLRESLRRLCNKTGIKATLHSFRRAFALSQLQQGTDLLTLSRLMGHVNILLLSRYAKQSNFDIRSIYKSSLDKE